MNNNNTHLADIRDIAISKYLSQRERIIEFVQQIRDPHHYRCNEITITAHYSDQGLSFAECLQQIFT